MILLKKLFLYFFFKVIIPLLFFIIFLFSAINIYSDNKRVNEIKEWMEINATIISSTITKHSTSKSTSYCPKIFVEFKFQDSIKVSKLEIDNDPCKLTKYSMEAKMKSYKEGKNILVLVNPNDTSVSRMPSYSIGPIFYLKVFLLVLGIWGTIYTIFTPLEKLRGQSSKKNANKP